MSQGSVGLLGHLAAGPPWLRESRLGRLEDALESVEDVEHAEHVKGPMGVDE